MHNTSKATFIFSHQTQTSWQLMVLGYKRTCTDRKELSTFVLYVERNAKTHIYIIMYLKKAVQILENYWLYTRTWTCESWWNLGEIYTLVPSCCEENGAKVPGTSMSVWQAELAVKAGRNTASNAMYDSYRLVRAPVSQRWRSLQETTPTWLSSLCILADNRRSALSTGWQGLAVTQTAYTTRNWHWMFFCLSVPHACFSGCWVCIVKYVYHVWWSCVCQGKV